MESNIFIQLAVSLLLGLLVGLQRERTGSSIAGIRTFPLITVFGTVCAWLASHWGGWIIAAGVVSLAAVLFVANLSRAQAGDIDSGLTTELAALVLFGVGACVFTGPMAAAILIGGAVAVLLHGKTPMHRFVAAMDDTDMKAIMQFAAVTLIVLPALPNKYYGPYGVLNPFQIWLVVILVSGMSLAGYLLFKMVGRTAGMWIGGILGGVVSGTATTVSYARRSRKSSGSAGAVSLVVMIASTVQYLRLIVLVAVVTGRDIFKIVLPLAAMFAACAVITAVAALLCRKQTLQILSPKNPAELKTALLFGALFAVVRFGTAVARAHFGDIGVDGVSALIGATDTDAVALSVPPLVHDNATVVWRAVLIATMANFVVKTAAMRILGSKELLLHMAPFSGAALLAAGAILWLWPGD